MSADRLVQLAATWRPQRPGTRGPHDIPDALVEPDWGGARVVAALSEDRVALYRDGGEVAVPEDMLEALLDGFTALEAIIEGHVTLAALQTGTGAFPPPLKVERPPLLLPRLNRIKAKEDPFIRVRDREAEALVLEPETIEAVSRGEPHAFVATDLLWLDGEALDDVPLLERKRLLEAVLGESYLVRVSAFVRPSSQSTLVAWGTLGFGELSYRASNSRYLAGRVNEDWAIAQAPASASPMPQPTPPR